METTSTLRRRLSATHSAPSRHNNSAREAAPSLFILIAVACAMPFVAALVSGAAQ